MHNDWLQPDWPAPSGVGAVMTTRKGGVSVRPFDTMNVGVRVGDDGAAVEVNRNELAQAVGAEPIFLHQVHGVRVVQLAAPELRAARDDRDRRNRELIEADASFTWQTGVACVVQVADCMPVLMASRDGRMVGAAHAGWRGLAAGIIPATLRAMSKVANCDASNFHVWLGPCIGPQHFEVGEDVLQAFPKHPTHFKKAPRADGSMRWLADLPGIARDMLGDIGVASIHGGAWCTVSDAHRFFSYRRDTQTGRHAAAIWIK